MSQCKHEWTDVWMGQQVKGELVSELTKGFSQIVIVSMSQQGEKL